MIAFRGVAVLLIVSLLFPAPLSAAIILLKGDAQAVKGVIVVVGDAEIVVSVPKPDGTTELRKIPRAQIDDILHTVSPDRLKALDPAKPKDYRNYAEELAEKREDPEARGEALRLFLIAAWLDGKNLGRSSLLGMIALARSPAEERKLRAMAYLVDPEHEAGLLKTPGAAEKAPVVPMPAAGGEGVELALAALKLYRQGKSREAAAKIKQPGGAEQLARLRAPFTLDEFVAACTTRDANVTDPLFVQVLAIEARAAGAAAAGEKPAAETEGAGVWSRAAARGKLTPAPSLSLESLLEFDPRENVYRDGKWVRP